VVDGWSPRFGRAEFPHPALRRSGSLREVVDTGAGIARVADASSSNLACLSVIDARGHLPPDLLDLIEEAFERERLTLHLHVKMSIPSSWEVAKDAWQVPIDLFSPHHDALAGSLTRTMYVMAEDLEREIIASREPDFVGWKAFLETS
jgi:hypothetical protein